MQFFLISLSLSLQLFQFLLSIYLSNLASYENSIEEGIKKHTFVRPFPSLSIRIESEENEDGQVAAKVKALILSRSLVFSSFFLRSDSRFISHSIRSLSEKKKESV